MKIRVGDYVYCPDIHEYGTVVTTKDVFHPAYNDVVTVKMEHDGTYRTYLAHILVGVDTKKSPVCESASDKTESDEVRQTSDSGAQKGSKLARYDMIPADALDELARHYGKGAEKYAPFRSVDEEATAENIRKAVQKECNCGH